MVENRCYDSDCDLDFCNNPEHYNFVCFDPNCEDSHCENKDHYNKKLLRDFQEKMDFSIYDHREEIDYDEDVDISICGCPDCADDHDHNHDHSHSHEHSGDCGCGDEHHEHGHSHEHEHHGHNHSHGHSHEHNHKHNHNHGHDEDCGCGDEHNHEHGHSHGHDEDCGCGDEHNHGHGHSHGHDEDCGCGDEHNHEHLDACGCDDGHHGHNHGHEHNHGHGHSHEHNHNHNHNHNHDEECCCGEDHDHSDDISLCGCPDCVDEPPKELLAEGKPLISNRPIQIILGSGILFAAGHILEFLQFNGAIVSIIFMLAALIAGYQIAILAAKSLYNRHTVGPALLVCIACVASFIIGHPEEGAAVSFLYFIAEFLEDYAEHRAKHSIKSLVEIAPETARVKVGDGEEIRKIEDVDIGEIVIVKPGDKVPLDGEIVLGNSSIDQASITGESIPVTKSLGDNVFAGTVNQDGYLEVIVTKKSKDAVISKIVTLVKRSQLNRGNTETMVEKIAKYYTPVMICISAAVAFIPPLLFGQDFISWVYKALSIMVISCPCAFLISTPIGMVSAITAATRKGVLVKGSAYVEEMRNIKAVIFDKTGTLTEGKLELSEITVLDDSYSEEEVVKIAASLENQSNHPIAKAVIDYADLKSIEFNEVDDFKNIPGKGILGSIDSKQYYAANESLIDGSNFNLSKEEINQYSSEGKTVIFLGDESNLIAILSVVDKIRDNASDVINNLKDHGIKTVMLTGDNKIAAKKVADEIGIEYVYSNLLPEDKLDILDSIRNKFGDVAMVGDGINDAPALARSNIGIAMGAAGSDVAIETADIALMQDDISKLPYLFNLSKKTMNIIKQNISLAIIIKVLFVILAVMGLITLMESVGIGDLGLTMLVILNSFRIGFVKNPIF